MCRYLVEWIECNRSSCFNLLPSVKSKSRDKAYEGGVGMGAGSSAGSSNGGGSSSCCFC